MSQLLVRNLNDDVVASLKQRAKLNHRSLQAEVTHILENAVKAQNTVFWGSAIEIRENLSAAKYSFSDSADLVREDRE